MRYELPYPPTMNHYWKHQAGRHHISKQGKRFRDDCAVMVLEQGRQPILDTNLRLDIFIWHPDHRRRDIDNILKPLLDALQFAGVYRDDQQVCTIHVERQGVMKGGRCIVKIAEVDH